MLELSKAHEITSKIQAFNPKLLYKTTHGKKETRFQNLSITKLWLKIYN